MESGPAATRRTLSLTRSCRVSSPHFGLTAPLSPYAAALPPRRIPPAAPSESPSHVPPQPRGRPLDGWLIIDKPPGLTSTDVVNRVRRAFDAQKAGHGGTLDPLATGVLPIAFGAATKTVPYVMDGTKLYRFTLRFGEARDTDDADGQVIGDHRRPPVRRRAIRRRPAAVPRRHHADPAGLLRHQGRRRAGLRHGARGPRPGAGTASRPRRPL